MPYVTIYFTLTADFEKAMEDLNVCLQIRKDLLPSNDRSIAEV